MSYLDLVEEYPKEYELTLFEKILMAARRAKDLHGGKARLVPSPHKEPYVALEEIKDNAVHLAYRDEEAEAALDYEADEGEEEE